MGKHQGRAAHAKRPTGDSLVVVDPSMLQPAARGGQKAPQKGKKKQSNQPKKRKADAFNTNRPQKTRKKQQTDRSIVSNVSISSASILMHEEGGGASCFVLRVKKTLDVLAGLYWVLLARNTPRSIVVALPSQNETSPAQLAAMLKHLGLQAVALHRKMTTSQRHETVQRFKSSDAAASPLHALVLVTTDHLLPSTSSNKADVVLVGDDVSTATVQVATTKFAYVNQVTAAAAGTGASRLNSSPFRPEMTTPCLQQLQARLKLARQIVDISQRVGKNGAQDEEKWAKKLAKGADLDDDEDDNGQKKTKNKRTMTPDEQRLQALTEKLYVVLTRNLSGIKVEGNNTPTSSEQETDSQHRREKLEVLGLVTVNAVVGTAMTDERTSAQTRWMDFAEGKAHGGKWEGAVRHGASKDATSLALRSKLRTARSKPNDANFLSKWNPNKEPVDTAKWGGAFGKVCGHNEVVMNSLRAFYPQEVLNSKVCSKLFPAPGN